MWKQNKCALIDEWISKMWYILTIEYYLALRRKENLTYGASWMKLEDVMLSEMTHKKTNSVMR